MSVFNALPALLAGSGDAGGFVSPAERRAGVPVPAAGSRPGTGVTGLLITTSQPVRSPLWSGARPAALGRAGAKAALGWRVQPGKQGWGLERFWVVCTKPVPAALKLLPPPETPRWDLSPLSDAKQRFSC